ncbi:helix-turn-helix domain-containing protein [Streptomyces sp. NPDC048643]|uniref:helix-turn-helix domain-containing protein n=1 Tax=Streptomyces sp. NPDC048643 TaxID=3155637 RepID=UPI003426B8E2
MLFQTTGLFGMLHQLQLTPTAIDVLSVMVGHQDASGNVSMKQSEIDEILGVGQASMSRAMALLVERGIVIRSGGGRGHRYALNPAVAGYESQTELEKSMTQQLAVGGPPAHQGPRLRQAPAQTRQGRPPRRRLTPRTQRGPGAIAGAFCTCTRKRPPPVCPGIRTLSHPEPAAAPGRDAIHGRQSREP